MKLLLDTHILLWWLSADRRLKEHQQEAISSKDSEIFVSSASTWELTIKQQLGEISFPDDLVHQLEENGFQVLPIHAEHTLLTSTLPRIHSDPFDRLLIAQAIHERLVLVTSDAKIREYDLAIL